ncbi:MAG TPA: DUF4126 family protein [Gemmatimonadaceae bacterium]|nr:DUF4126 family protein [Gemmatimonadaceae bacterium]
MTSNAMMKTTAAHASRASRAPLAPLALLAAASGARTMSGIAAVARARAGQARQARRSGPAPRIVRRFDDGIANIATVLAIFEMMADKAPGIPDRVDAGPLFGRVLAGAVVGAAVAQMQSRPRQPYTIAGALTAFARAQLSFRMRRALSEAMPQFAAGLVEDVVVIGVVAAGTALLPFLGDRHARLPKAAHIDD